MKRKVLPKNLVPGNSIRMDSPVQDGPDGLVHVSCQAVVDVGVVMLRKDQLTTGGAILHLCLLQLIHHSWVEELHGIDPDLYIGETLPGKHQGTVLPFRIDFQGKDPGQIEQPDMDVDRFGVVLFLPTGMHL